MAADFDASEFEENIRRYRAMLSETDDALAAGFLRQTVAEMEFVSEASARSRSMKKTRYGLVRAVSNSIECLRSRVPRLAVQHVAQSLGRAVQRVPLC